jgi:hypothetical protein
MLGIDHCTFPLAIDFGTFPLAADLCTFPVSCHVLPWRYRQAASWAPQHKPYLAFTTKFETSQCGSLQLLVWITVFTTEVECRVSDAILTF